MSSGVGTLHLDIPILSNNNTQVSLKLMKGSQECLRLLSGKGNEGKVTVLLILKAAALVAFNKEGMGLGSVTNSEGVALCSLTSSVGEECVGTCASGQPADCGTCDSES